MKQYIVDAFADRIFEGNPAAVVPLDRWPAEELMMAITRENNLSETAFAVPCAATPPWPPPTRSAASSGRAWTGSPSRPSAAG